MAHTEGGRSYFPFIRWHLYQLSNNLKKACASLQGIGHLCNDPIRSYPAWLRRTCPCCFTPWLGKGQLLLRSPVTASLSVCHPWGPDRLSPAMALLTGWAPSFQKETWSYDSLWRDLGVERERNKIWGRKKGREKKKTLALCSQVPHKTSLDSEDRVQIGFKGVINTKRRLNSCVGCKNYINSELEWLKGN